MTDKIKKKQKRRYQRYDPAFAKKLPELFKNGEDVAEVCAELKIPMTTFYYWVNKYRDFHDAYRLGKDLSKAWWLKLGRAGACGKQDIQPATYIYLMKTKFKLYEHNQIDVNFKNEQLAEEKVDAEVEMKKRGIPIPDIRLGDVPTETFVEQKKKKEKKNIAIKKKKTREANQKKLKKMRLNIDEFRNL